MSTEPLRNALIACSRKAAVKNRDHFGRTPWLPNALLCTAGGLLAFGLLRRSRASAVAALLLGGSGLFIKQATSRCEQSFDRKWHGGAGDHTPASGITSFDEASSESFPASDPPARSARAGNFNG